MCVHVAIRVQTQKLLAFNDFGSMFGRFHTCYFTLHRGWMVCLLNCESSTFVLIFASLVSLSTSTGTTAINIGGLFPLISDHGNQELAAVMMALSQVNNKTDGVADTVLVDFQARLEKKCKCHCQCHVRRELSSLIWHIRPS